MTQTEPNTQAAGMTAVTKAVVAVLVLGVVLAVGLLLGLRGDLRSQRGVGSQPSNDSITKNPTT